MTAVSCSCRFPESRFSVIVVCRQCGGNVQQVNGTTHSNTETVAVLECTKCFCSSTLLIQLREMRETGDAAERKARSRREQRAKDSIDAREAERLVVLEAEQATMRQQVGA